MATVVIQSYRTQGVPEWLQRCMTSVRDWARQAGYEYTFVDDALFERIPRPLRHAHPVSLLPWTDLARLALLREKHREGYARAVWIDADVLILRSKAFTLPAGPALACRELWMAVEPDGRWQQKHGINNAVLAFEQNHPLLDFLHHACHELLTHIPPEKLLSTSLGTSLLTQLGSLYPLKLINHVGCLSPSLLRALHDNRLEPLRAYATGFGQPIHAANLCRSMLVASPGNSISNPILSELELDRVVSSLMNCEELLNGTD